MKLSLRNHSFLICDDDAHARRLVSEVVRGFGAERIYLAADGEDLLHKAAELNPDIVVTGSRVPKLSGLEFTRIVRAGFKTLNRATPIIVMSDTATTAFLQAARDAGVDEMLVVPFASSAVVARIDAVIRNQRVFVDSFSYTGPCRRRRTLETYKGERRRFSDPIEDEVESWEAEGNRELVRLCVQRISQVCVGLSPGDRRKLREIYSAVTDAETVANNLRDEAMGSSARSLLRYIRAVGASAHLDVEVVKTHIGAMQQLGALPVGQALERASLVRGLTAIVDKRLRRRVG